MYVLHYSPGACSLTVHALLHEIGVPFRAVSRVIADGAHLAEDYLALNPRGRVPTLIVDGEAVHESVAIINLLLERHPERAPAPPVGSVARARMFEWLCFGNTTLHAQMWAQYFRTGRITADTSLHARLKAEADAQLVAEFRTLDALFARQPYLLGDEFSVADLAFWTYGRWARLLSTPVMALPNYKAFMDRLAARPSLAAALAAEGITAPA